MSHPMPWGRQREVHHHHHHDSHYGEILLAAQLAQRYAWEKAAAEQARVEADVVRRGDAARQVLAATGRATPEQLQMIAEAEHVAQLWHARAVAQAQAQRNAEVITALVLVPLGLWLASELSWWWLLLAGVGMLVGLPGDHDGARGSRGPRRRRRWRLNRPLPPRKPDWEPADDAPPAEARWSPAPAPTRSPDWSGSAAPRSRPPALRAEHRCRCGAGSDPYLRCRCL